MANPVYPVNCPKDVWTKIAENVTKGNIYKLDVETIDIMARRQPVGSQTWRRMMTPGFSGKILDAYIGIHEYEG